MQTNAKFKSTVDRLLANSREWQVQTEQRYQDTISRLTATQPSVVDRYTATPQPGHGPGTYQPRAQATGKDTVSLHIPATAFSRGDWDSFKAARDKAIAWLRQNRSQVINSCMCLGAAFDLDHEPLVFRDSAGQLWYNCAIDNHHDLLIAQIQGRSE